MNETDIILALEQDWVTKEQLQRWLNMGERGVRAYIEELNIKLMVYGRCVLSTASKKGYHIPDRHSETDLQIAMAAEKELENKAISIFERRKAIRHFIERAKADNAEPEMNKQLTLF